MDTDRRHRELPPVQIVLGVASICSLQNAPNTAAVLSLGTATEGRASRRRLTLPACRPQALPVALNHLVAVVPDISAKES